MIKSRARSICTDPEWIGRADCKHCGIRHMMLFSDLHDNDFDHILQPIDNLYYKEMSQIYCQGESGKTLHSIRHGLVKLVQTQFDGSCRIVAELKHEGILSKTDDSQAYHFRLNKE